MTDRNKRKIMKPHRLVPILGAFCLSTFSSAVAMAQPEITPPTDIVGPAVQTDAVNPVFYLDLADVAPLINVNIDKNDPNSGTLDFSPTGIIGPFAPGSSSITWTATSSAPGSDPGTIRQNISIWPQVNFHMDQRVREGTAGTKVIAEMTGLAPTLEPVTIKIELGGTALVKDITELNDEGETVIVEPKDYVVTGLGPPPNYSFEIAPGETTGEVTLDALADTRVDSDETVIFNMTEVLNADIGYRKQNIYILHKDYNAQPLVEIKVSQASATTQIIDVDGGEVTVKALIDYNGVSRSRLYEWSDSHPDSLITSQILTTHTEQFSFDPASIPPGYYKLTLTLYDRIDGDDEKINPKIHHLQIEIAQGAGLTDRYNINSSADDDGDGIPDTEEGYYDDDNDGIPNYLDNIKHAYLLPSTALSPFIADVNNSGSISQNGVTLSWQANNTVSNLVNYAGLVVSEPGTILSLGDTAKRLKQSHARIPIEEHASSVEDNYLSTDNALWDLTINMIHTDKNSSVHFVMPLPKPLPKSEAGPLTLLILDKLNEFIPFQPNAGINDMYTAKRDADGYCPPPKSDLYIQGLFEGMECLQLAINDGGSMDRDPLSNPLSKKEELNGRVSFTGNIYTHRLVNCLCDVLSTSSTAPSLPSLFSVNNFIQRSVISGENGAIGSIDFVIPLETALPVTASGSANFYILTNPLAPSDILSWKEFIVTPNDRITSAPRNNLGYCPPPSSSQYVDGIQAGNECLQLTMLDNGFNDTSPLVNEIIVEGGIFAPGLIDAEQPSFVTKPPDYTGSLPATTPEFASSAPVIIPHFDVAMNTLPALAPGGFDMFDSKSGTTTVIPTGPLGPLPSGRHEITWTITDLNNNSAPIHKQIIDVLPQFNFAVDQIVPAAANTTVTVTAYLDGLAANYPVTIPLTITGTAGFIGPSENNIEITQDKRQGSITLNLTGGAALENIVVALDSSAPLINAAAGTKTSHTITLRDDNAPPIAKLITTHGDIPTRTIVKGLNQNVIVRSEVFDPDTPSKDISYDWSQSDSAILPLSGTQTNAFNFNPEQLADGLYTIRLTIDDGVARAQKTSVDQLIRVISEAQQFTAGQDTDGDKIADEIERLDDTDTDGIPNFLDAIDNKHWLQAWPTTIFDPDLRASDRFRSDNFVVNWSVDTLLSNKVFYPLLLSTEPGLKLSLGDTAFITDTGHARVPIQTVANLTGIPFDTENDTSVDGYMIDIEISDLTSVGQHITINIPLTGPIPKADSNPQLFIFNADQQWSQFSPNSDTDFIRSSPKGENLYCPPHAAPAVAYSPGVSPYDECLQLSISDGGENDADGIANGIIKLRTGLFIKTSVSTPETPPPITINEEDDVDNDTQSQNKNDAGTGGGGAIVWWLAALLGLASMRKINQYSVMPPNRASIRRANQR